MKGAHKWNISKSTSRLAPAIGLVVTAAVVTGSVFSGGNRLDWIQSGKHVYLVLPPTLVTDGAVGNVAWSPDGAYCLIESAHYAPPSVDTILEASQKSPFGLIQPSRAGIQILEWNRATNQVKTLWQTDNPKVQVLDITWLAKSSSAYVTMGTEEEVPGGDVKEVFGLMSLNANSGAFSWVPGMENLPRPPQLFPSPLQAVAVASFDDRPIPKIEATSAVAVPVAAGAGVQAAPPASEGPVTATPRPKLPPMPEGLERLDFDDNNLWTLGADGQVKERFVFDTPRANWLIWGKEGLTWFLVRRDRDTKQPIIAQLHEDGTLTPTAAELYKPAPLTEPELAVESKPALARQRKTHAGYHNVWISGDKPTFHSDFLVSADGSAPQISPTQDAIFYVEGGIAKVRSLVALTEEQKKALYEAAKREAISDAKQVGLGLLMYANDYDDLLPPGGGLDNVDPYLKNMDMLNQFNYTPPGDLNSTNMQNPASTPLGTMEGPGGQAVVYGDGHVTWHPNP